MVIMLIQGPVGSNDSKKLAFLRSPSTFSPQYWSKWPMTALKTTFLLYPELSYLAQAFKGLTLGPRVPALTYQSLARAPHGLA